MLVSESRLIASSIMARFIRPVLPAAIAAALLIPGIASAQDGDSVFDRLFGRPNRAAAQDMIGQNAQPTTDQVLRIERLEAQIRQMTGTIEQLQHRNHQLEAHIRRLEGGDASVGAPQVPAPARPPGASAIQTGPTLAAPAPAPLPVQAGRRPDVFDPALQPNAPGAPRPLGTIPGEPPAVVMADPLMGGQMEGQIGAPGGRSAGTPLDLSSLATGIPSPRSNAGEPTSPGPLPPPPARNPNATGAVAAVAPPTDTARDYYDLAYGYVVRKDYALAQQSFDAFLKKFPNDRRAIEAQFWLGESMFQRQLYDQAASSFLDLSTKHASHPKAPEALLRLGQSLAALKQKEMACATFAEIGRKYPRASNTVKQGVEREQKRVRC
jgi:tol-pal system protein YbgF